MQKLENRKAYSIRKRPFGPSGLCYRDQPLHANIAHLLFCRLRTHQWCFLLFNVILFHALLFGADFVEEYLLQSSPTTYTDAQTLDVREKARKLDMSLIKGNVSRFFHISSADACGNSDLFLLAVISSNAENITRREVIRKTWANISQVKGYNLLTLFAIGIPQMQAIQEDINKEFAHHRDIIQGTFLDSSNNVILKTTMIMRWAVTFCPKALFILKSDEETFVNYRSLMEYLLSLKRHAEDLYIGRVYHQVMPIRDPLSKHYMPTSLYSGKYYPDYCSATAYVISQDVARKVFVVSMTTVTPMPEDIYVGICAQKAGVVPIHSSRFSGEKHIRFNRCCYKFIFSSFEMTGEQLARAWEEINDSGQCTMLEMYYGLIKCKALTYLDKLTSHSSTEFVTSSH
ncbi:beta-1,3-galactosyltransferase 9 [Heterodontus francisci]|uniref:beta-1,3-galactosyltransferase 9 n=1 Tax=Heterodontus francisci TaxID=7792 RepID=UPI00355BBBC0